MRGLTNIIRRGGAQGQPEQTPVLQMNIIGPPGSGKTTLTDLIRNTWRLFPPPEGFVLIETDGQNIAGLRRAVMTAAKNGKRPVLVSHLPYDGPPPPRYQPPRSLATRIYRAWRELTAA